MSNSLEIQIRKILKKKKKKNFLSDTGLIPVGASFIDGVS